MRHRLSLMACARWETDAIVEWLLYHRAIGFDHVYLYCNDDDPAALHAAVLPFLGGPAPFVTFHHFPFQGQQFHMYMDGLRRHRHETEWLMFLDIDEFLALRGGGDAHGLIDRLPPNQGCVTVNWLFFGHNFHAERPPGSVLATYTRRAAGLHATGKTLTRTACIDPDRIDRRAFFWHGWEGLLLPGAATRTVLGDDPGTLPNDGVSITDAALAARMIGRAVLHHYAFRSAADLRRRWERGAGGDFHGQEMWKRVADADRVEAELAPMNEVEDRFLADVWAARLRGAAEATRLLPAPPGPNLALGRAATQSSIGPFSRGRTAAEDAAGAVNGAPTGGFQCHTAEEARPWWQVDLGAPARVHEIRLFNRLDSPAMTARLREFAIETSRDGAHWMIVHVARPTDPPVGGIDGAPLCLRFPAPVPARFVRIVLRGGGVLHLDQVEVYGEAAPPGGVGQ